MEFGRPARYRPLIVEAAARAPFFDGAQGGAFSKATWRWEVGLRGTLPFARFLVRHVTASLGVVFAVVVLLVVLSQ